MTETHQPKPFVFVLMPFHEDFHDVYNLGIKQAAEDAGAYCERLDEQIFDETMLDRIYNQISKADVLVADMSRKNPNVFYEVGYAHALGKTVILLTENADDIPADLRMHFHIVYKNVTTLIRELTRRIKWHIENQALEPGLNSVDNLAVYSSDQLLNTDSGICFNTHPEKKSICVARFSFSFNNKNLSSINDTEFKVVLTANQYVTRSSFRLGSYDEIDDFHVNTPDGRVFLKYPEILIIEPDGWLQLNVMMVFRGLDEHAAENIIPAALTIFENGHPPRKIEFKIIITHLSI